MWSGWIRLVKTHPPPPINVEVYLKPGEAVALNTRPAGERAGHRGRRMGMQTAILDTSATRYMPDVLEMPLSAQDHRRFGMLGEFSPHLQTGRHQLFGRRCGLANTRFLKPLTPGQKLVFMDMAHRYTMVKTTTFNKVAPIPASPLYDPQSDELKVVRQFGYEDFRNRLS